MNQAQSTQDLCDEATAMVEEFRSMTPEQQGRFIAAAQQVKTMVAHFSVCASRLEVFRTLHEKKLVCPMDVEIFAFSDEESVATGSPQDVMFLIGEIANQGEDVLIRSYRL